MNILYAAEFSKQFSKLPQNIKTTYKRQEAIFKVNWRDPRLHTKKLKGDPVLFSFRITRSYRALFFFPEKEIAFFATIGNRKDVYL